MTGAVLCGGAASRMGCAKQHLVLNDGRTMLQRVAGVLAEVCSDVVVVGADGGDPWRSIMDQRSGQGPLAGIEALLSSELDQQYLVCPCDMPWLTADPLHALSATTFTPVSVLQLTGEPSVRPLPMRVSAQALGAVTGQLDADRRAVHRFLETTEVHVVQGPAAWAKILADVDTPEQWDTTQGRS
jgi:molybdopterin-guanine dinucleotide biosynthesis protein A